MQSKINIQIGSKAPAHYLGELLQQCDTSKAHYGDITDRQALQQNLALHCLPELVFTAEVGECQHFSEECKTLMDARIKTYYQSL